MDAKASGLKLNSLPYIDFHPLKQSLLLLGHGAAQAPPSMCDHSPRTYVLVFDPVLGQHENVEDSARVRSKIWKVSYVPPEASL